MSISARALWFARVHGILSVGVVLICVTVVSNAQDSKPSWMVECNRLAKLCLDKCGGSVIITDPSDKREITGKVISNFECRDKCYNEATLCNARLSGLPCSFFELPDNCKDR